MFINLQHFINTYKIDFNCYPIQHEILFIFNSHSLKKKDLNDNKKLCAISLYYVIVLNKYDIAKTLFIKAINNGYFYAYYYLGELCFAIGDFYEANKYLKLALEHNIYDSLQKLGYLYLKIFKNTKIAKDYLKLSILHNNKNAVYEFCKLYDNMFDMFLQLSNLPKNKQIEKFFTVFQNYLDENQIKFISDKLNDCSICLDQQYLVVLQCNHSMCFECYTSIKKYNIKYVKNNDYLTCFEYLKIVNTNQYLNDINLLIHEHKKIQICHLCFS
uniref:RING-type domain-containing protein n=1 Tax=viral metagenome TaxID=1070528 RepID=A0A6C0H589_9ZZZZ